MTFTYIISGFAVGALVGLTGVGGGSLMTPLLTMLFGVSPNVAVGTDLAFASITKATGTLTHRLKNTVEWSVVRLLCYGALPSAMSATILLKIYGGITPEIGKIIRYSIAVSVLLTVVAIIFRGKMLLWINAHPERHLHGKKLAMATMISGAILGILVTITSIGAGAIGATLLVILYPRMHPAHIAGTDIAYAVPLTAIAAMGHWWLGSINWELLGTLLIGSLPGITLGSILAKKLPEKFLRAILATTLTLVAIKLAAS